ncbi:hypothetical protein BLNAU_19217 [Blattamonas nauphoetae]|uniref:Uncharacterized protein n=1 Tax=Blattamonas nauphoetae TaxID=2049346 RepID=A0ABQ9X3B7_9EUKA|nr:hypothetical protein BLNAU_19217 [Blattamonas nauphoetae]
MKKGLNRSKLASSIGYVKRGADVLLLTHSFAKIVVYCANEKSSTELLFPHTLVIQRDLFIHQPSLQTQDAECPELNSLFTAADPVINFCILLDTQAYTCPI